MKLIPKAKPVRIRVSSGGIEHSSLSTLRENFDYFEDILPLCEKGSIGKWLKQQNETEVLVKVNKAFNQDKSNDVIYNVNLILSFFPDVDNEEVKDYYDIIKIWAKKDYKKDIQYFLNGIKEKEVLINILVSLNKDDNGDEYVEKLIENRLNQIKPKREQKLVDNNTGLNQIPELVDIQSPAEQINTNDNSSDFRDLAQTIKTQLNRYGYVGIDFFNSCLQKQIICKKDNWPDYLRCYVGYVMLSLRKFAGSNITNALENRYLDNFRKDGADFSFAIKTFFWGDIKSYIETSYDRSNSLSANDISVYKHIKSGDKASLFDALDYIVKAYTKRCLEF